jgi:ribonuclease D
LESTPKLKYEYVDSNEKLQKLCEPLASARIVAIDIEADSLHHYYEKVCLIQMTFKGHNFIVDPLADMDFSEFLEILSEKTLILHDAGYDLRMMRSTFGFELKGKLFDTMLAAQLLGFEFLGLAAMLERFFNLEISKVGQRWDWSARPLTPEKLQYAMCDTQYLRPLVDIFTEQLKMLGRSEWHKEACERSIASASQEKEPADPDRIWRIKGSRALGPMTLTVLKKIWHWRQDEAQKSDLPPYKIMINSTMIDVAGFSADKHDKPLEKGPRIPKSCTGGRLRHLKKAIDQARQTPKEDWEQHKKQKHGKRPCAMAQHIAEDLKDKCIIIGEELKLPPQIIAPRAAINSIANNRPGSVEEIAECSGLMVWQSNLISEAVAEAVDKYQPKK